MWIWISRVRIPSATLPTFLEPGSSASAIGSNASLPALWGTAPPAADRLRSRPAGPRADGSNPGDNELCVDSGLASFGAFCGARHSCGVGSLVPEVEASTHHGEGPNTSGALTRCSRLHRIHPTSSRICNPPRSYAVSRRMYRKLADYAGIWATWHLRGKADLVHLLCKNCTTA